MLFTESGVMCPVHSGTFSRKEIRTQVSEMLQKNVQNSATTKVVEVKAENHNLVSDLEMFSEKATTPVLEAMNDKEILMML